MRIGLLNFPINDVGGINSWTENFWDGLVKLGYDVGHLYLANQTRFGCELDRHVHKRRFSLLPADFLSLLPEAIDDTIKCLNENFDAFVFCHPSPHPTKAQLSSRGEANWQRLYKELKDKKIVVFHDEKWRLTNDWMADVQGTCDLAVAAQHRFLPSVEDWGGKSIWCYFPMPVIEPQFWPHDRLTGIVFTQWLGWKNHDKFLPMLRHINVPFEFYGGGIRYHQLKAEGEFAYLADLTEGEEGNQHQYHGFKPYPEVMEKLRQSRLAIDLSTRGYTNMSHWEPLWFGCPNFVERRVLDDPFCELPRELCEQYDLDESLPERINEFEPDTGKLHAGMDWMEEHCTATAVAERIMNEADLHPN